MKLQEVTATTFNDDQPTSATTHETRLQVPDHKEEAKFIELTYQDVNSEDDPVAAATEIEHLNIKQVDNKEEVFIELTSQYVNFEDDPVVATAIEHLNNVKEVDTKSFEIFKLNIDFELKEFVEKTLHRNFERGQAYYEFQHQFESIFEDNMLIFLKEVSYYTVYRNYCIIYTIRAEYLEEN